MVSPSVPTFPPLSVPQEAPAELIHIAIPSDTKKRKAIPSSTVRLHADDILSPRWQVPIPFKSSTSFVNYQTLLTCLREGCRKWHHQGKLTKIGQPTPDQLAELATSGLETLTLPTRPKSTLDAEEINTNTQTTGDDPVKGSGSTSSKKSMKANGGAQADLELIRRFAEGSITRGDFSIVGNARSVLEAREIISMKDLGSGDWSEMIKSWKENHVPVEDEDEPEYRWLCPKCKGII